MAAYDVRFMKSICDDTGHERLVCQSRMLVNAPSERKALQKAQNEFCREKNIAGWSSYADAIETRPCEDTIVG